MGTEHASSTGDKSYTIVGAGVFGASTALHLIRAEPRAKNKVVRADYADIDYMRLALEAKERWANDALWKPFYHESGAYWVSTTDFSQRVQENFKKFGVDSGLLGLPVDEARKTYGGIFEDGDYTGVKEVFINKLSGWAEAKEALRCTIEEAVRSGVEYVEADVSKLEFDEEGATSGIVTSAGEVLRSDCVILSTGAYTVKLLADSAPDRPELHAGDRFVAVGVTEGFTPVSGENAAQLYGGPVGIAALPPERGQSNGSVPHSRDRTLKFWGQTFFTNTRPHPNGRAMSSPPSEPDYAQFEVPATLKEDVDFAGKTIFGRLSDDFNTENYRVCWDALSPSADFIISAHSASKNLYIATIGSFHGWKFLPVLGKYVVQLLQGSLDEHWARKWAWDKALPPPPVNGCWPTKELSDLN
ncbi:hypothetical protein Daus18300_002503 [Diaporthe australafricana]|uniref:FAD dependent oxidoreductase domain-containing protein n=1 Tax=Diaporthe australafricana TaxID=127596 RepID=A0ABR3XP54_9PEZI